MKYLYLISLSIGNISFFTIRGVGVYDIPITPFLALTFVFFIIEIFQIIFNGKRVFLNIPKVDFIFFGGIISLTLINIGTSRITTIAYFITYAIAFIILVSYLKEMALDKFIFVLKSTIYLYFMAIFISNVTNIQGIYLDWPVFREFYHISSIDQLLRYRGFALEPSLAGFVLVSAYLVLCICYNNIQKHPPFYIHLIMLYLIYAINSGFGYLLYFITITYLNSGFIRSNKLVSFITGVIIILLTSEYGFEHYRITGIINFIISLDYTYLDPTAAIRMSPLIDYIKDIRGYDIHHFIGHGMGSSTAYFYKLYYYLTDAAVFNAFFAEMLFDLGIIGVALFGIFAFINIEKKHLTISSMFVILLLFNAGINTQVFWWVLILLFSLKTMPFPVLPEEKSCID